MYEVVELGGTAVRPVADVVPVNPQMYRLSRTDEVTSRRVRASCRISGNHITTFTGLREAMVAVARLPYRARRLYPRARRVRAHRSGALDGMGNGAAIRRGLTPTVRWDKPGLYGGQIPSPNLVHRDTSP